MSHRVAAHKDVSLLTVICSSVLLDELTECRAEVGHKDALGDPVDEGRLAHGGVTREHNLTV